MTEADFKCYSQLQGIINHREGHVRVTGSNFIFSLSRIYEHTNVYREVVTGIHLIHSPSTAIRPTESANHHIVEKTSLTIYLR